MPFSELYKIMVNKVTFAGFRWAIVPVDPPLGARLCCFRLSLGLLHLVVIHSLSNERIKSTNMSFSVLFWFQLNFHPVFSKRQSFTLYWSCKLSCSLIKAAPFHFLISTALCNLLLLAKNACVNTTCSIFQWHLKHIPLLSMVSLCCLFRALCQNPTRPGQVWTWA